MATSYVWVGSEKGRGAECALWGPRVGAIRGRATEFSFASWSCPGRADTELSRCTAIPVAVLVIDRTQHVDG